MSAALAFFALAAVRKAWEESDHPRDADGKFSAGASSAHEKHNELVAEGLKGNALAKAHKELARKALAAADFLGDDDKKKAAFFADKAATHTSLAAAASGKAPAAAKPKAVPKAVADGLLTQEQHEAMQAYAAQTGVRSGYEDINDSLAGTLPAHVGAARAEAAARNAEHLNEAIRNSPLPKAMTLYRGSTLPAGLKVGDLLQTPRLVSTTKDPKVAQAFAEMGSKPGAHVGLLEIALPKGTPVLDVNKVGGSKIRGEKEHLLGSNQKLYVLGIDNSGPVPRYKVGTEPPVSKTAWDESQHPRDEQGRFGEGGAEGQAGGQGQPVAETASTFGQVLHPAKQKALQLYISGNEVAGAGFVNHLTINRAVSDPNVDYLHPNTAASLQQAQKLRAAIRESKLPEDRTFYRGGLLPADVKVGDVVGQHGFTSTSSSRAQGLRFAKIAKEDAQFSGNSKTPVLMTIEAPKGTAVLDVEHAFAYSPLAAETEKEHLFHDKVSFKVTADNGVSSQGYRLLTLSPVAAVAKAAWDEASHPRDAQGRFASTGSGKEIVAGQKASAYKGFTAQDHRDAEEHYRARARALLEQKKDASPAYDLAKAHGNKAFKMELAAKKGQAAAAPAPKASAPASAPTQPQPAGLTGAAASPYDPRSFAHQPLERQIAPVAGSGYGKAVSEKKQNDLAAYVIGENFGKGGLINYEKINSLAAGSRQGMSEFEVKRAQEVSRTLSAAIAQSPLPQDATFFRGASVPAGLKMGDTLAGRGFTSASLMHSTANRFALEAKPAAGRDVAIIKIQAPKGTPVLDVERSFQNAPGSAARETEHIFGKTTNFRVVADEGRNERGHRQLVVEPVT